MNNNNILKKLIFIDDLESYLHELKDKKYISKLKKIGFEFKNQAEKNIENKISDELDKLPLKIKSKYIKLRKRFKDEVVFNSIVPIISDKLNASCFGCCANIPIEELQIIKKDYALDIYKLNTCENCGRFIFLLNSD